MEIKTILDTYNRYLDTFKDADTDIFTNYAKITDFIDTNCNGLDELDWLKSTLDRHCIGRNIKEIKNKNIKVKANCADGWSTHVVESGYRLLNNIQRADKVGDSNTYNVNIYNFLKLADSQNPHLQLYLYLCFSDRIGSGLFTVTRAEIEEAAQKASKAVKKASEQSPTEDSEADWS